MERDGVHRPLTSSHHGLSISPTREYKRPPKPSSIIGRKRPGSIIRAADELLKEGGQIPKPFFGVFAGPRDCQSRGL
jgi:hypothetical protein